MAAVDPGEWGSGGSASIHMADHESVKSRAFGLCSEVCAT
jgi:hypothetical protein